MKLHMMTLNRSRGAPPTLPTHVAPSSAPDGASAFVRGGASSSSPDGASASPIVMGGRSSESTPVTRGEKSKRGRDVPSASPQAAEVGPCGSFGLQTPPSALAPSSRSRILRSSDGGQTFDRSHRRNQSMSTPASAGVTSSGYLADVSSNVTPLKSDLPPLDEAAEADGAASSAAAAAVLPKMPDKLRPLVKSLGNNGVAGMYAGELSLLYGRCFRHFLRPSYFRVLNVFLL